MHHLVFFPITELSKRIWLERTENSLCRMQKKKYSNQAIAYAKPKNKQIFR